MAMSQTFFNVSGVHLNAFTGETYANDLVLSTGGEEFAVGTEADTSDVKITILVGGVVGQVADLLSSDNIEDLCRPVAASGHVLAVCAEANTAHDTLVNQVVHKVNVQPTHDARVEDGVPIITRTLQSGRQLVGVEVGKLVSDVVKVGRAVLETLVRVLLLLLLLLLLRRLRWRGLVSGRRGGTGYIR